MDASARPRLETAALLMIVLIGLAVRLDFLSRPMQLDEAYSYNEYASKPVLDGLSWYTLPNNHLLNTLLVHASTRLFGDAPWAIRLPALAAGLATIPATFALSARQGGRSSAVLAAALVAASAPLIDYSTNARGYTMVVLCTVLLALTAERLLADARGGRARDWVNLTILPMLGGFAIPIMAYAYGGIVLWLLLAACGPRRWRRGALRLDRLALSVLLAVLGSLLLYLPAMLRVGADRVLANPYVTPRPRGEVLAELPGSLLGAWLQWNGDIPRWVTALFLLAWGLALLRGRFGGGPAGRATALFLTVLGCAVAMALAQRVVPYVRVWLFALPLYAACIAAGLAGTLAGLKAPGWLPPALGVVMAAALALGVARGDALAPSTWITLSNSGAIADWLGATLRPDDAVVVQTPGDAVLKYEFLRRKLPVEALYDYRIARAGRLFVVVDRGPQTLAGVLASAQVSPRSLTPARLVREFGGAAVYELRRPAAAGLAG